MPDRPTFLAWALLPLRRYAQFRGRSTRSELVAFSLLYILVGVASSAAAAALVSPEAAIVVGWLLRLALLCPSLALAVRRLHDSGRSGWWTLLALSGLALDLWRDLQPASASVPAAPPSPIELASGLASLAILILLLWNDDPEANRYGPNPRYDSEAQGLP